jgi:hypothetical protein
MQSLPGIVSEKKKKTFYIIVLLIFSILFNQYYGYKGIYPIDSFFPFNSGYDVLNGFFPFKDYWTRTSPFIDLIQALFFKTFGVSWFSYVFHASVFNFLFTISTFYTLSKFKLDIHYCFFYSLLVAILAYPSAGTPYGDHQSSYLSIIAIFCFILALRTNLKIFWFFLPIIFGIAFLTKQAPAGSIFLVVIFLSIIYFTFNFNLGKIILGIVGSLVIIFIFLVILKIGKISLLSFFEQYILFPLSLGENRLEFLFPLEFKRIFLRFKLLHLSSLILFIAAIKKVKENYKYLKHDEFLIIVALIGSTFALIAHQLMIINGIFIFFMIPILAGFSHIYYLKYFKNKNYIVYLLIFLCISSTAYYGYKYINKRNFMDLNKVNFKNAIDAKILDKKLSGLKWITALYPNNPKKEILKLQEAINIINKDNRNKTIATDYQFISVILSSYDYSPNKYWGEFHAYPTKGSKYFEIYRKFFIDKLKENKIEIVYIIKPLWGEDNILKSVLNENCVEKKIITDILESQLLLKCEDLEN